MHRRSVGRRGRTGEREDGREGGREEGREGRRVLDTRVLHNAQVQAWLCTPVVVSIHSAMTCWREGLRAVGR